MRNLLLGAGSLSLMLVAAPVALVSVPTAAKAEHVEFCRSIEEVDPNLPNLGKCIGAVSSDDKAWPVHLCFYLEANFGLENLGYDNMAECVADMKAGA